MIYNSDATAIALKNISFLICNAGFKFNNCSQRKTNSMPARVCTSVYRDFTGGTAAPAKFNFRRSWIISQFRVVWSHVREYRSAVCGITTFYISRIHFSYYEQWCESPKRTIRWVTRRKRLWLLRKAFYRSRTSTFERKRVRSNASQSPKRGKKQLYVKRDVCAKRRCSSTLWLCCNLRHFPYLMHRVSPWSGCL